jgi:epoxide hydrolase-like predicted phosphatase
MTTPTTLILDFGGVLTTDQWDAVRACAVRAGLAEDRLVDLLRRDVVIAPLFARLERGDIDQVDFEPVIAVQAGLVADGLLARMCSDLAPDADMLAAVARLRAADVRIGILSNSCGAGYFDPYDGYQLDERADVVVVSHLVGLRKPEPAIYSLAIDKLGVPADECVYVDDVAAYVTPARTLGMTGIHHTSTTDTIAELARLFSVDLG